LKEIFNFLDNYFSNKFKKKTFVNSVTYYYNLICFKFNSFTKKVGIKINLLYENTVIYKNIQNIIKKFDENFLEHPKVKYYDEYFFKSLNLKNKIIKQNKALTPEEVLSYAITSGSNRSHFYSPLHSFLPLFISGIVFCILTLFIAIFFRDNNIENKYWIILLFIFGLTINLAFWFSKFYTEKKTGRHINFIKQNIVMGFYLFIMTEGLCFLALFWTFLHSTLAASIHIGIFNPGEGVVNFYVSESYRISKNWDLYYYHTWGTPGFYNMSSLYFLNDMQLYEYKKIKTHVNLFDSGSLIDPWKLPFINTLILLSSAASLNASHCYMLLSRYFSCLIALVITIIFGLLFVFMQFKEYKNCSLNYNDGIYPSCFFGITGLHGIHVILGIIALSICLFNIFIKNFSPNFHQTFYFSIFYWHFVDVIWIAVWLIIYLWPGSYFFTEQYLSCYTDDFFIYNLNTNHFLNLVDYNAWTVFLSTEFLIYKENNIKYNFNKFFLNFNEHKKIHTFLFSYNKFNTLSIFKVLNFNYLMDKIELEHFYSLFLENRQYFNFNLIKKNVIFYCVFMTEMHNELVSCVYSPISDDIQNKYYRFLLFIYMDIFLSKTFVFLYLKFFFSPWYFYNFKN